MFVFSDREIATAIWLGVLLAFALSKKAISRDDVLNIVKTFLHWKIMTPVAVMIVYTAVMVYLLHFANFWTFSLLKDTIIWFFSGMVLAFSFVTSHNDEKVFSRIVTDTVKIVVFLEFLVNTYTFSLLVELFLVPSITWIIIMDAFAKTDEKYSQVASFTSGLRVVIGLAILTVAAVKAAADFGSLLSIDSVRQILLAPVLSVLFAPLIYLLLLYARYEDLFVRLRMGPEKDRAIKRYAKRQIIRHLGMSVQKVGAFTRVHALDLMRVKSREDVDRLLANRGPYQKP